MSKRSLKSKLLLSAAIFGLAVAYFFCAKFGLSLAFVNRSATAVWPPTGLCLAALLLWGPRLWPGVFLGAFLANIDTQGSWVTSVCIASGNTLEAVLGAWLVNRFVGGRKAFDQAKNLIWFVLLAAVLSTTVSASVGVVSLCAAGLAHWNQSWPVWLTWWLGDLVSDLVITPLLILWIAGGAVSFKPKQLLEAAALLASLLLIGRFVFLGHSAFGQQNQPLGHLALLPLLWAAFRFGQRGAIASAFVISSVALLGTLRGFGPFAGPDPNASLLFLQIFIGAISVTALMVALAVAERQRAERRLQVQDAVSRVLAEAQTLKDATPGVFRVLHDLAGWEVGVIWNLDRAANELHCVEFWHVPRLEVASFEAITRQRRFAPGIGLPGRVWSSGKPAWISDVTKDNNFPRGPAAAQDGLHRAICFPLKLGDEIVGTVECFSHEAREPDEHFLQVLGPIGGQLGHYLERRRAEEASQRSEALRGAILESALDCIISIDRQGKVIEFNPASETTFGYKRSETLGRFLADLIIPSRFREGHRRGMERYLATGEGPVIGKRMEIMAMRSDGSEIPIELSLNALQFGSELVFTANLRDISERKRAEESARFLAALVQSSGDAIISKDLNGVITSWNAGAESLFGYSPSEMIGQPIGCIVPPDRQEEEDEILARLRQGGSVAHAETVRVAKDGRSIEISLTVSPIRDEAGTVTGISNISRDITERKKSEAALAEARQKLQQYAEDLEVRVEERTAELQEVIQSLDGFCYSIAHDLRAPLRALGGFSNELFNGYAAVLDRTGQDYVARIRGAAARMDQLISDLLKFGRLNTAELPAEIVPMGDLMHKVLALLEEDIEAKHARVRLKEPLLPVRANTIMVEQVLVNLIGNAIKFVPPERAPEVDIWTQRNQESVRISVRDNGIGINELYAQNLFQPFVRLVNGSEFPGTGIGLAIVRKGVERMGGQAGFESQPDKGSCFWIELPGAEVL